MKKLLAITALCLCCTSAFAGDTEDSVSGFIRNSRIQVEMNADNLDSGSQPLGDLDWNFDASFKTNFNDYVYSSIDVIKFNGSTGYGASVGVQDPMKNFTPYSELSYMHDYKSNKLVSAKQFQYESGVKLGYFARLSPYIEADDYLDPKKWYIKLGAQYKIDDRFYVLTDYSFPSKTGSNKLGFGFGVQF